MPWPTHTWNESLISNNFGDRAILMDYSCSSLKCCWWTRIEQSFWDLWSSCFKGPENRAPQRLCVCDLCQSVWGRWSHSCIEWPEATPKVKFQISNLQQIFSFEICQLTQPTPPWSNWFFWWIGGGGSKQPVANDQWGGVAPHSNKMPISWAIGGRKWKV